MARGFKPPDLGEGVTEAGVAQPPRAPGGGGPRAPAGAGPPPPHPGRPAPPPPPAGAPPAATPATRRLARELGVDLSTVKGSGPGGRITDDDVRAAAGGGPG